MLRFNVVLRHPGERVGMCVDVFIHDNHENCYMDKINDYALHDQGSPSLELVAGSLLSIFELCHEPLKIK